MRESAITKTWSDQYWQKYCFDKRKCQWNSVNKKDERMMADSILMKNSYLWWLIIAVEPTAVTLLKSSNANTNHIKSPKIKTNSSEFLVWILVFCVSFSVLRCFVFLVQRFDLCSLFCVQRSVLWFLFYVLYSVFCVLAFVMCSMFCILNSSCCVLAVFFVLFGVLWLCFVTWVMWPLFRVLCPVFCVFQCAVFVMVFSVLWFVVLCFLCLFLCSFFCLWCSVECLLFSMLVQCVLCVLCS